MFVNVKKLVEKAASKKHMAGESSIRGLKAEEVNPCLTFHYGIPSGSSLMSFDSVQNILAIATNDGRIKLFGMDNTQALLQSAAPVPSKFLQFAENHGILLNINFQNQLEVWDIDKKELLYVHISSEEITSFVLQQSLYMYIGNCHGDISVLKLVPEEHKLVSMAYTIPFTESYDKKNQIGGGAAVISILPQPMAETKRILIMFEDGLVSLWGIQESKVIYYTGGNTQILSHQEQKKAVTACWACPYGSKLVVGYNNGEIFIWTIPTLSDRKSVFDNGLHATPNVPLFRLNLGYKTDRIPIVSLRWVFGDGKVSRLYVNGYSDVGSYSFQVIVLNESSESRTVKLVIPLTETCLAMEIISCCSDRTKNKQNALLLLSKSGQLYFYNDLQIEQYLLQCQSRSIPSLPSFFTVKLPFTDSSITAAKIYAGHYDSNTVDEEQLMLIKKCSNLFMVDKRDTNNLTSMNFKGYPVTNLYITGHEDGAVNFWNASCPLMFPILSIKHQDEDNNQPNGVPVTTLHFDLSLHILVTGDQTGLVRIITFKKQELASENVFSFLQGKQGGNYSTRTIKVKGGIQSISVNPESKHLAIGTDKGFVFVFEIEGTNFLYQKQFPSLLHSGVLSMQFMSCSHNGYVKNVLLIGMQDSSVLAIEEDTGSELNANAIHTKKPTKALLMQILDTQLVLCSENTVRLYSLSHAVQGIKKVCGKKKLHGICCYASIVYGSSSDVGLVLIFGSGKVEIRSLPDLVLLKEASLRGFPHSTLSCANPRSAICASLEGELIIVNGDQEILFFSVLSRKPTYRNLEHVSQVYKKNIVSVQEQSSNVTSIHKEKKKGIFGIVKDLTGNKSKNSQEVDVEDSSASIEELSVVFSTANFSQDSGNKQSTNENGEEFELDIDDIDLEDTKDEAKEWKFAGLNKQKLGKKFLAIKGKLKTKTDEKVSSPKDRNENEKATGSIDDIKKKYGYANNESSVAKIAENKLRDNVKKLQGINDRASHMKDTAQSFSSLSKELLKNVQKDKQ